MNPHGDMDFFAIGFAITAFMMTVYVVILASIIAGARIRAELLLRYSGAQSP